MKPNWFYTGQNTIPWCCGISKHYFHNCTFGTSPMLLRKKQKF